MPGAPAVFAHQPLAGIELPRDAPQDEQREFARGLVQNVRGVREGNLVAVGVGAVDVVEADGVLGDHFEPPASGFENLGVNLVAQRRDQPVHAEANFLEDQTLRRRLQARVYFHVVTAPAQHGERLLADVAGREDAKLKFRHGSLR